MWNEYASGRMDIIEKCRQVARAIQDYANNKDVKIVCCDNVTAGQPLKQVNEDVTRWT